MYLQCPKTTLSRLIVSFILLVEAEGPRGLGWVTYGWQMFMSLNSTLSEITYIQSYSSLIYICPRRGKKDKPNSCNIQCNQAWGDDRDVTYQWCCHSGLVKRLDNATLRWLDWIFWGWYLPTLSINYIGMSKDMEKRLTQLYYIKMKISYDLGFIAIRVAMAT